MSYRDNKDAMRARVAALEAQTADAARDHAELAVELAGARKDLLAVRQQTASSRAPRWMYVLGAVGAGVAAASALRYSVSIPIPLVGNMAVIPISALGLGMGLLGLFRATSSRLVKAAAWFCFFKAAVAVASSLLLLFGAWPFPGTMTWLVYIACDLLMGAAMLSVNAAPTGLRKACGVLLLVEGGVSLLLLAVATLSLPGNVLYPVVPTLVHFAASGTLTLLFILLSRSAGESREAA